MLSPGQSGSPSVEHVPGLGLVYISTMRMTTSRNLSLSPGRVEKNVRMQNLLSKIELLVLRAQEMREKVSQIFFSWAASPGIPFSVN